MMIPFPTDRSGEATLYTRWQREDIAGEGFYNCSDINILTDDSPIGWSTLAPYVINGVEAQAGQEVWFRLFSAQGEELILRSCSLMTAIHRLQCGLEYWLNKY